MIAITEKISFAVKNVIITFCLSYGVPSVFAQVTPTNEWVNFYGLNSLFEGSPLPVGATINAFDPQGINCGTFTVTTQGHYGFMLVYRDDALTPGDDEGAVPGDSIRFEINGAAAVTLGPEPPVWTVNGAILQVEIAASPTLIFRVERSTGNVFTDGMFVPSGADMAERINVSEPVEPGDVVELDPANPWHYRKARSASKLVAGVITTKPGFTLGNNPQEMESDTRPMLALMGRVPVKATTENGAIRPGDLLTISSKPGYAMRCAKTKECVIIGKALEGFEKGEGLILILVMAY